MKKEIYNKNIITKTKRILSHFADAIIFLICSIVIYSFASLPIAKAITPFDTYQSTVNESYQACKKMITDSHLVTFDEKDNEVNAEIYLKNNLNYKLNNFTYDDNHNFVDIFYHFYLTYNNNNLTFNNTTLLYDFEKINTDIYKVNDNLDLFVLTDNDINKPIDFTSNAKALLSSYLQGEITAENQDIYYKYMNIAFEGLNTSVNFLGESDQYKTQANIYNSKIVSLFYIYSISSLITFVICFFIYYLLVPILLGKGQTLAKKILHIGVFTLDMKPIKPTIVLLRSLTQFLFYFHLALFIPYMQLGTNCINLPLFPIGNSTFYLFHIALISFLLCFVDFMFMSGNLNNRTLRDRVVNVIVLRDDPEIYDLTKPNKPSNVIEQENYDRGSKLQ